MRKVLNKPHAIPKSVKNAKSDRECYPHIALVVDLCTSWYATLVLKSGQQLSVQNFMLFVRVMSVMCWASMRHVTYDVHAAEYADVTQQMTELHGVMTHTYGDSVPSGMPFPSLEHGWDSPGMWGGVQ